MKKGESVGDSLTLQFKWDDHFLKYLVKTMERLSKLLLFLLCSKQLELPQLYTAWFKAHPG